MLTVDKARAAGRNIPLWLNEDEALSVALGLELRIAQLQRARKRCTAKQSADACTDVIASCKALLVSLRKAQGL